MGQIVVRQEPRVILGENVSRRGRRTAINRAIAASRVVSLALEMPGTEGRGRGGGGGCVVARSVRSVCAQCARWARVHATSTPWPVGYTLRPHPMPKATHSHGLRLGHAAKDSRLHHHCRRDTSHVRLCFDAVSQLGRTSEGVGRLLGHGLRAFRSLQSTLRCWSWARLADACGAASPAFGGVGCACIWCSCVAYGLLCAGRLNLRAWEPMCIMRFTGSGDCEHSPS